MPKASSNDSSTLQDLRDIICWETCRRQSLIGHAANDLTKIIVMVQGKC